MSLKLITEESNNLIIDLRYATENNFTGTILYKTDKCYLISEAEEKLKESVRFAKFLGYKLKILDAYRPISVQKKMWNQYPDPNFISNPNGGKLPHCRGIAVDITLCYDKNNEEVNMGTEFDCFAKTSYHASTHIKKEFAVNRLILLGIMSSTGWDHNPKEWWHYQLFDYKKYNIL